MSRPDKLLFKQEFPEPHQLHHLIRQQVIRDPPLIIMLCVHQPIIVKTR